MVIASMSHCGTCILVFANMNKMPPTCKYISLISPFRFNAWSAVMCYANLSQSVLSAYAGNEGYDETAPQSRLSLRYSRTHSRDVDEDSCQNLDIYPGSIAEHACFKMTYMCMYMR